MSQEKLNAILTSELPLMANQFTTSELLSYMRKAYGTKVNGEEFTYSDTVNWVKYGSIPEVYGGHNITAHRMSGIRILEIEGLSREDFRDVDVIMKERQQRKERVASQPRKGEYKNRKLPRRTRLYYKTLRLPVPEDVLPDNWSDIGIRGDQLKRLKRRNKKK